MSLENIPITPKSPESQSEFITVPEWNETVQPAEAPSAESVEQSAVEQVARVDHARRQIDVIFEDDDIGSMKIGEITVIHAQPLDVQKDSKRHWYNR